MFNNLTESNGVNWLTLAGGGGLNLISVTAVAFGGTYLAATSPDLYESWGSAFSVLAIFIACGLAGFITGRIADTSPLKHALLASLGAVIPLAVLGVLSLNPTLLLFVAVAVAGAFNGGMLSMPRHRHYVPRDSE